MSMKQSGGPQTFFERNTWVTKDGVAQAWVNEIIWRIMAGPGTEVKEPQSLDILIEAFEVCRRSIQHNGLQGMAAVVYGDMLKKHLGQEFYDMVEADKYRSDVFIQELHWLLAPRQGGNIIVLGDFPMRKYYAHWGQKADNPRLIRNLVVWTPTLSTREEVSTLLGEAGYERGKNDDRTFYKITGNVRHSIVLRSSLWESSKNWSSDIERAIWDRASSDGLPGSLKMDPTDHFLIAIRSFAIDTLLSGGIELLDLAQLVTQTDVVIDWELIKSVKNAFQKPDWFWAPMLALVMYENKTGRRLELPAWVREGVKELHDSFWFGFIESRLCWANPDTKLGEFPRAYVKLAKGT